MAAVLALAMAPAAGAAPAAFTPTVFALSDPAGRLDSPASIAAGPDQTMWIANAGPLRMKGPERFAIGRVDLGGRYRLYRTKGETFGIAVMPDGKPLRAALAQRPGIGDPHGLIRRGRDRRGRVQPPGGL